MLKPLLASWKAYSLPIPSEAPVITAHFPEFAPYRLKFTGLYKYDSETTQKREYAVLRSLKIPVANDAYRKMLRALTSPLLKESKIQSIVVNYSLCESFGILEAVIDTSKRPHNIAHE